MDASQDGKESLNPTVVYAGLAISFILLISLGAYTLVQLSALSARIDSSSNVADLSNQIVQLNSRLAAVEKAITPPLVPLYFLYDSSDRFTQNALSMMQQHPLQGFTVTPQDVKGNLTDLKSAGYQSLPALFVSNAAADSNAQLKSALNNTPQVLGGYAIDAYGLMTDSKTMLGMSCNSPNKASLFEFVDYSCPTCGAPDAAVAQVYQGGKANLSLEIKPITFDSIRPLSSETAQVVGCVNTLFPSSSPAYRAAVFNLSASGNLSMPALGALATSMKLNATAITGCLQSGSQVQAVTAGSAEASVTYGLRNSAPNHIYADFPSIVVDCKYVFPAVNASQIRSNLCNARPDICPTLPAV